MIENGQAAAPSDSAAESVWVARVESPIGTLRLASTPAGLAFVELPRASGRGLAGWLRRCAPGAKLEDGIASNGRSSLVAGSLREACRDAAAQITEFLAGKRRTFELVLDPRGTPFQLEVWRALCEIPYGETISYGELARRVGRPHAVRAVGAANGANPLALIVPCHRVVNTGGKLGGYGGGLALKARLLAMERAQPGQGKLL